MTSPQSNSGRILRIIDANFNRISEGLRLLEEIARMLLDDAGLTQQLKSMRHDVIRSDDSFQEQLLQSRNSAGDVGVDIEVPGEEKGKSLPIVLVANARRVQESLRTLEELAKLPGLPPGFDSEKFKHARFSLYTIEQELMSRLLHQDRQKRVSGLYIVVDTEALKGRSHLEVAAQVIRGGARVLQLHDKLQSRPKLLPIARQLQALCDEHKALFIVNDYLDVALDCYADGLHLGQDDLPVAVARKLLPPGKLLGCSVTSVEQAVTAQSEGADYVAVEAIYPTASKTSTTTLPKVVGLEILRQVRKAVTIPVVAIGGITVDNVADVVSAGADSVAVISAVLGAASPEKAARQMAAKIEGKK